MARRKSDEERLRDYDRQYRELLAALTELGYVWNGSVTRQMLTCGKKSCACHQDPQRRHGPYAYWSTKLKGRTVSRILSPEEADLLEQWIKNRRALKRTERRMLVLSRKVAPLILRKTKSDRRT